MSIAGSNTKRRRFYATAGVKKMLPGAAWPEATLKCFLARSENAQRKQIRPCKVERGLELRKLIAERCEALLDSAQYSEKIDRRG